MLLLLYFLHVCVLSPSIFDEFLLPEGVDVDEIGLGLLVD